MPELRNRLQPYFVFKAETTRVNELYWKTSYAYSRVAAVLGALATSGHTDVDPRVDKLWPSIVDGERRHASNQLSDFKASLGCNLATLRRTSVLFACSAFEHAITSYFVLSCLYRPAVVKPTWTDRACPELLGTPILFDELLRRAVLYANRALKGPYSSRIRLIETSFSTSFELEVSDRERLDSYQRIRNSIAHDQGLNGKEDPTQSARETLRASIEVSESDWKQLIRRFLHAVTCIDAQIRQSIVTDCGLTLALRSALEQKRDRVSRITIGAVAHEIAAEWQIRVIPSDVLECLAYLQYNVSNERALHRRVITIPRRDRPSETCDQG